MNLRTRTLAVAAVVVVAVDCFVPATPRAQTSAYPEADPELVRKLATGQTKDLDFSQAGRRDMLAVTKALIDAGCAYRRRADDPPDEVSFTLVMQHLMPKTVEDMLLLPLLVAHPAYTRTATFVGLRGCDSKEAQTLMNTLFRAVRMAPPPTVEPPARPRPPTAREEPSSANHSLRMQSVAPWWKATGAFNPGGRFEQMLAETRVLSCDYRSPTAPHPEGRYAWFDPPPAGLAELRKFGKGHPVGDIGPLQLQNCPKTLIEFDDAKRAAIRSAR